jgi:CheY-like chemotaxis protein
MAVEHPLALITLDIMLPDMDGWEFLSRVKELPSLRSVPVVIISIVADQDRGFALGAAAVLQKPLSRKDLTESLQELKLLPEDAGRPIKVLIIDDDPEAVEVAAHALGEMASVVLRAFRGREAVEMAKIELPDLIILDLLMPDLNGFDIVSILHAHAPTAQIPILVVTAKQVTSDDRKKLSGHVTAILEKPGFDHGNFTTEVRRAMSGRPLKVMR